MARYGEPNWPWIIFGDGMFGEIKDMKVLPVAKGVPLVRLTLTLTRDAVENYGLTRDDFDQDALVSKDYPKHMLHLINADPSVQTYLLECDFFGNPNTPIASIHAEKNEAIKALNKRIIALKAQLAKLYVDMKEMTSMQEKFDKATADRYKTIASAMGSRVEETKEDYEEEGRNYK